MWIIKSYCYWSTACMAPHPTAAWLYTESFIFSRQEGNFPMWKQLPFCPCPRPWHFSLSGWRNGRFWFVLPGCRLRVTLVRHVAFQWPNTHTCDVMLTSRSGPFRLPLVDRKHACPGVSNLARTGGSFRMASAPNWVLFATVGPSGP